MARWRPLRHRCLVYLVPVLGALAGCARVVSGEPDASSAPGPTTGAAGTAGPAATGGAPGPFGEPPSSPRDGGVAGAGVPSADGPNCGLIKFTVERLPPSVLIVLDKSASMMDLAKGLIGCILGKCNSKWTDMKNALTTTVTATQGTIDWGLKLFPTDSSCGVSDGVAAPVAPQNAAAVNAVIAANRPGGLTPTRLAVEGAGRYLTGLTTPNPRYVVLATDGLPTCGEKTDGGDDGDDALTIAAVAKVAAAGIPVFVIGVGTDGDGDATLSAMATAGGKPRAASPAYYPVTTSADLTAALSAIGGQIVSCTLPIKAPPDPTNIAVDADGMRVPRNAADGWEYGPDGRTIQLGGTWCTRYQNGTIKDVQTIFGCPGIVIP